jgi:hypothetical protein
MFNKLFSCFGAPQAKKHSALGHVIDSDKKLVKKTVSFVQIVASSKRSIELQVEEAIHFIVPTLLISSPHERTASIWAGDHGSLDSFDVQLVLDQIKEPAVQNQSRAFVLVLEEVPAESETSPYNNDCRAIVVRPKSFHNLFIKEGPM